MDQSHIQQPSRPTGIPRLSRLPLPKSSIPTPSSTTHPSTLRKTPSRTTLVNRTKVTNDNFKVPSRPSTTSNFRNTRPVNSTLRASSNKPVAPPAIKSNSRPQSQASARNQDDSNEHVEEHRTPDRRKSLAERTVDSIAKLPPTPGSRRRRSSFFNTESPMVSRAGSRPQSAAGTNSRPGSRADYVPPMPALNPTYKASNARITNNLSQSTRRSISLASSTSTRPTSTTRPTTLASTVRNTTVKPAARLAPASKSSQTNTAKPKSTVTRRSVSAVTPRPALRTSTANINNQAVEHTKTPPNPSKSSAALREQIRAAKAARKSLNTQTPAVNQSNPNPNFDLASNEDPFNQGLKGGALVMRKRVDVARSEGRLNISNMSLKEIPEEVLKMYDYEYNKQHSGIAWGEVRDLTRFIAADNEIESIPDTYFPDIDANALGQDDETSNPQFGGIEHLDLHGNLLFDLPVGLRRLETLTFLNLSRNRLMNDSMETIAQIKSLKELRITDNALSGELTPAIGELVDLEILELQGNKLSSLPTELGALVNLKILNLSNNQLMELPMAEICDLPLTQLLLSKNKLSGTLFTKSDAEMSRLHTLDVSINSLQSLAIDKVSLPALKELNASFNRITSLPDMSTWTSLASLMAADNKITEVPDGFIDLDQLRIVDFTGNDFSRIDSRIGLMSGLENIKFAANPIRERKFLTMGTSDLKRDLKARLGLEQPGQELD